MTDPKALTDDMVDELAVEIYGIIVDHRISREAMRAFVEKCAWFATREQTASTGEPVAPSDADVFRFLDFLAAPVEQAGSPEEDADAVLVRTLTVEAHPWPGYVFINGHARAIAGYAAPVEQAGSPEATCIHCGKRWKEHGGRFNGCPDGRNGYECPIEQAGSTPDETPQGFIDWFGKNYYGEVAFGDPAWHAQSIFRNARYWLRKLAAPAPDETLREAIQAIVTTYEFRSEIVTSDADCAGLLYDIARRALATPTKPEMQSVHPAAVSGKEKT